MKWMFALASALIVSLLAMWTVTHAQENQSLPSELVFYRKDFQNQNLQLGYYDLLAEKKELYDPHFENRSGTLLMTLTSPDDNHFVAKGKLIKREDVRKGVAFNYQPIFHSNPGGGLIVNNSLKYMTTNVVSVTTLKNDNTELLIAHNGLILVSE